MSIPKKIYQSWKSKNLTGKMADIVLKTQELNPEYEYELYDDVECREFIFEHFGINYANAFDILIPGAFKCDFWRYAKLYVDGGVYMDIDMVPLVPFREIIKPSDEFLSVADLETADFFKGIINLPGIFQSFIACKPKHPILMYALQLSFANIATRRAGIADSLSITGPVTMGVSLNLFWEKMDTHSRISAGVYEGVRLLKMDSKYTYDLNGRKLFVNKYDGYDRGVGSYNHIVSYYKDDPRLVFKRMVFYIFIGILVLAIIGVFFTFVYKRKWKACKETCSLSREE